MEYKIKLEIFEGPLDLLLHLIKDNEINIYDIPIYKITEQYLKYIEVIKSLNLDIAGDFLVMASELTKIKSKMLLPVPEVDSEESHETKDPRDELVKRLIEYRTYKNASEKFKEKELYHKELFSRKIFLLEKGNEEEMITDLSVYDLLCAFKKIMDNISSESVYKISLDEVSVKERIDQIVERLNLSSDITFDSLFSVSKKKMEIVANFLAILELIKQKVIKVFQMNHFDTIRIIKVTN